MEAQNNNKEEKEKKMKILCLHGFRTSGKFLQKQISKWDPSILADHFHLDFPDGIFPAGGKSDIEGIFPPPYFEWFQFNKDFTEYTNLEECISYLTEYITTKGPFDGLLGFSQGATLSALLLGYKAQGKVLKDHPPMKLFVSISGSKFRDERICEVAYKDSINVKSVHFIGEKDWLKLPSQDLATAFHNPLIIRHPQGHTVPRLDESSAEKLRNWTMEILRSNDCLDGDKQHLQNGETKKSLDKEEEEKPRKDEACNKILRSNDCLDGDKRHLQNGETKKSLDKEEEKEPRKEEACNKTAMDDEIEQGEEVSDGVK